MRAVSRALGALFLLLLLAVPAAATTYLVVADPDLAEQAPVIVEAVVTAVGGARVSGPPATDYQLQVAHQLQGKPTVGSLVVRVPGGERPDGLGLKIWGAPVFRAGERVLLFLVPDAGGTFHVLHLMLGAFHVETAADGHRLAVRDLSEAKAVGEDDGGDRPRDLERFKAWLADRAAGSLRAPDYFATADLERSAHAPFRLLDVDGVKLRWFEFDEGGGVSWKVNRSGQPGLAGGGFTELQRALAAWNAEPATPIHYAYVGATQATAGLAKFDGINAVAFDQPVADPFDCRRGGVLAIGGPWYDKGQRRTWEGEGFISILGADVVTNEGIACWFARSPSPSKAVEELLGHELGHTLGLAHSCGNSGSADCDSNAAHDDALMRAFTHDDGRGARLTGDDQAALQALYRPGGGAPAAPPPTPANLTVERTGLAARLLWEDRAAGEDGVRVYRREAGRGDAGRALVRVAELPAGTIAFVDAPLQPGGRYEYQVAAFNARGESRSPPVTLAVPRAEPLQALGLTARAPALRTGEPVDFSVAFAGPARQARWDFGGGWGRSDALCAPAAFCATHIFAEPGTRAVKVRLLGDLGQVAERTMRIRVEGPPLTPTAGRSFLPGVLSAPRGDDAVFRSDLALANDGSTPTLVRVAFQPRGLSPPGAWQDVTLAPGASVLIPDVLRDLLGASGQGALSLSYLLPAGVGDGDGGAAGPRIFAASQADAGFGSLTGEEPEAGWSAEEKIVAGLLQGGGIASTLLVANLDDENGQVTVELFDGEGQPVGSPALLSLGPHVNRVQRLDRLFLTLRNHTGPFSARFRADGIRFSASATLLGGEIELPLFLPAGPVSGPDQWFLPRVTRGAGPFNTFQFSTLMVANPAPQARELRFELRLRGRAGDEPRVVTLTLPPSGSLLVEDVLRDLFALAEATGSLRVSWSDPSGPAPRVLSLAVSSPRGAGRRFAARVDGHGPGEAAAARSVSLGAAPSSLVRTAYGAVNLGDRPAILRLSLKGSSGSVVRSVQVRLRPKQHFEEDLLAIFPGFAPGLGPDLGSDRWTVVAEVLGGGPISAYLAQTDAEGRISFTPGSAD